MNYLLLGIGLLFLVKGADILIEAASKIAKILKVSAFIVGLFIVAMGTSAPEAAIGVFSGIGGVNLITLGDVIGSNIINIALVIGITAMIFPLEVDSLVPRREILISIFTQVCLVFMIYTSYTLSRVEAATLLLGMVLFTGYIVVKAKKVIREERPETVLENEVFEYIEKQEVLAEEEIETKEEKPEEHLPGKTTDSGIEQPEKAEPLPKLILLFVIGLAGLIGGAELVVNNAVKIAYNFGLSEEFIGLTIVAFGTSLPELVTCLIAAYRKEEDIAVGNIVGSSLFNVLFVLGMSALIHPITVKTDIFFDLFSMIATSVLLFIITFFFGKITKKSGFLFVSVYVIYMAIKLNSLG